MLAIPAILSSLYSGDTSIDDYSLAFNYDNDDYIDFGTGKAWIVDPSNYEYEISIDNLATGTLGIMGQTVWSGVINRWGIYSINNNIHITHGLSDINTSGTFTSGVIKITCVNDMLTYFVDDVLINGPLDVTGQMISTTTRRMNVGAYNDGDGVTFRIGMTGTVNWAIVDGNILNLEEAVDETVTWSEGDVGTIKTSHTDGTNYIDVSMWSLNLEEIYLFNIKPDGVYRGFSFRRLENTKIYSARIRRDNDDSETNILLHSTEGLTLNSLVSDGGTLGDWVGSNNADITMWYDHIDYTNNASQTTDWRQPRIINSGSLILVNGEPSIYFDGTEKFLNHYSPQAIGSSAFSLLCLVKSYEISTSYKGIFASGVSVTNGIMLLSSGVTNKWGTFANSSKYSANSLITSQSLIEMVSNAGNSGTFYHNGANDGTFLDTQGQGVDPNGYIGGSINQWSEMDLQEIILYEKDITADKLDIEANINEFYDIFTPPVYLLDFYPNAERAYSLRKLRTGELYSIRIRRDSDDAVVDVFLDVVGGLELTSIVTGGGTLATWVGTDNGYVDKWYDQSGNGSDSEQPITANQPKIIDSGSLVLENGRAAIEFDGINDDLAGPLNTDNSGWMFTIQKTTTEGVLICQSKSDTNSNFYATAATNPTNPNNSISVTHNSGTSYEGDVNNQNSQSLTIFLSDGSNTGFYVNGTLQTTNELAGFDKGAWFGDNISTPTVGLSIGSLRRISAIFTTGAIQEMIIYSADQSSNRVAIETDINNFYSIY